MPVKKVKTHAWESDFKILGNSYQLNFKCKISQALFIRKLKPAW